VAQAFSLGFAITPLGLFSVIANACPLSSGRYGKDQISQGIEGKNIFNKDLGFGLQNEPRTGGGL
jgi:hypothetical protein